MQNPVILDDFSEPDPDLSVARPREDDYGASHPLPSDLFLVIEVADTSVARDRRGEIPRYGRTGVPEAWLFDLEGERVELNRGPGPEGYSQTIVARRGDTISPQAFPDVTLSVDEILGPTGS